MEDTKEGEIQDESLFESGTAGSGNYGQFIEEWGGDVRAVSRLLAYSGMLWVCPDDNPRLKYVLMAALVNNAADCLTYMIFNKAFKPDNKILNPKRRNQLSRYFSNASYALCVSACFLRLLHLHPPGTEILLGLLAVGHAINIGLIAGPVLKRAAFKLTGRALSTETKPEHKVRNHKLRTTAIICRSVAVVPAASHSPVEIAALGLRFLANTMTYLRSRLFAYKAATGKEVEPVRKGAGSSNAARENSPSANCAVFG